MSKHRLCEQTNVPVCPELFRITASNWIDDQNLGETSLLTKPPAGIRLRWNCPFPFSNPAYKDAFPSKYIVYRAGPFQHDGQFFFPNPTVGHLPRNHTPLSAWKSLSISTDGLSLVLGDSSCDHIDAVYLEMNAGAPIVTLSLIGTDGLVKAFGEVGSEDRFYFEMCDIASVHFSARPWIKTFLGFFSGGAAEGVGGFEIIGEISATAWLTAPVDKVKERISRTSNEAFVSMIESNWTFLQAYGKAIAGAYSSGNPIQLDDINVLRLAGGLSWETATLIGCGFIDGEHPDLIELDVIDKSKMLTNPTDETYCYYVGAETANSSGNVSEIKSSPYFADVVRMPKLETIKCRPLTVPVTRSQLTNVTPIGLGNHDLEAPDFGKNATASECFYCSTEWELESAIPPTEIIFTSPRAEVSAITGVKFEDQGRFRLSTISQPVEFRKLRLFNQRSHDFRVPFYDSDIWLDLAVGDSWDRRQSYDPTKKIQPDIKYNGKCVPISKVICNSAEDNFVISLDKHPWAADSLASHSDGKISLMIKDPALDLKTLECTIGPATANADGNWQGELTVSVAQGELSIYLGGTLKVGGFSGRILAFGLLNGTKTWCTFEAVTECAGAQLFPTDPGGNIAQLCENPNSDRIWIQFDEIDLQMDGHPVIYELTKPLSKYSTSIDPHLTHSMTLYFATRLTFQFEGVPYFSPISSPLAVPYIHPPPKAPSICFSATQISEDYYGRTIIRVNPEDCHGLSNLLDLRLSCMAGPVPDISEFDKAEITGVIGSQSLFAQRTLFDAFPMLNTLELSASYTIGIRYVRTVDHVNSEPCLKSFLIRGVGKIML